MICNGQDLAAGMVRRGNVQKPHKYTRQEECPNGGGEPAPYKGDQEILEGQSDDLAHKEGHLVGKQTRSRGSRSV